MSASSTTLTWARLLRLQAARGCVLTLVALCLSGCAQDPLRPNPFGPIQPFRFSIDVSPTWSHDGRSIAFHRRFASSYGPPGIYVVDALGGIPRYLAPGDIFWPLSLRFSPDDRQLLAVDLGEIIVANLETGVINQPIYVNNGVAYADWAPDGRTILYARILYAPCCEPPDSGGVHLLDLARGTDRPLVDQNGVVRASDALWAPDGRRIAAIDIRSGDAILTMVAANGAGSRVVLPPVGNQFKGLNNLRWRIDPVRGMRGLEFNDAPPPPLGGRGGSYYINPDGSGLQPVARSPNIHEALSPDGSQIAVVEYDSRDSSQVLFIERYDDLTGATRRQLTFYDPPPEAPLISRSPRAQTQ